MKKAEMQGVCQLGNGPGQPVTTKRQLASGNPAISVDTKKKELVGDYKNGGRELRPKGQPEAVKVHDFVGDLGRASPYGVYDIGDNTAWVSGGFPHRSRTPRSLKLKCTHVGERRSSQTGIRRVRIIAP